MKGPLKLSLAIALALSGADAFALGLGSIQVKSGLNQPLDAEIPVLTESAAEAADLHVAMAAAEDFQRVGLNRSRINVPIDFALGSNARGQTVIKVTTKDVVREPFLDFLVEVNWAKGKVLREYTVLLDPPVTAPAKAATIAAAPETAPAKSQPLAERPVAKPVPPVSARAPRATAPVEASKPAAPTAAPKQPAAEHRAASGEYGPVAEGETLSQIAQATRDENTNVSRMMLAMLKANPNAFFKDNINALKRGAILRIPSSDEIKATGSLSDVAAAVRNQNDAWTSAVPTVAPTLVARAGAKDTKPTNEKPTAPAAPAKQERLALVPPRAGKGDATSEHAGASGGSSKETADAKAELARTKEALTSREQEVAEMKSRVKQLEDLSTKDQRLITLKDSEIADLQAKLRGLQAKVNAAPAATTAAPAKPLETPSKPETKPADSTATKTETPKITLQDLFNDTGKPPVKTPPATASTATPPPATTTATPTETGKPVTPNATGTPPAVTSTPAPTSTTLAPTTTPAPTATTPPATTTTPPTASTTTAPIKPVAPVTVAPLESPAQPWYQNPNLLLGGGGALLLVGLLALLRFMRRPKALALPSDDELHDLHAEASAEEQRLLDELAADPSNTTRSLELLRLYYSQGDVSKFEAAAEAMHANVTDPEGTEWQEAVAMGAVLAPHNPLFGGEGDIGHAHHDDYAMAAHEHEHGREAHDTAHDFHMPHDEPTRAETFDLGERDVHATQPGTAMPEESFDYDMPEAVAPAPPPKPAPAPAPPEPAPAKAPVPRDEFGFDLTQAAAEPAPAPKPAAPAPKPAPAPAPAPAAKADDFFVGEDAIGTKLDLAKAYLDMGDPEGARSMLDEVMSEGNDAQKGEARKLLAEIKV